MKPRRVRVVPHDHAWKGRFEAEAAALRFALGDEALAVHHIGSTSVPGLRAKPTIDVLIEVREIRKLDGLEAQMAHRGYEAWGEYGIPGRRFFTRDRGPDRLCNVHAFEAGSQEVERHLAFRDHLIQHAETARAYGDLKRNLAERFPTDMEAYMEGKDAFIKETEREALSRTRSRSGAT
ncbi:MAG TPA: GrpB family protein [Rubrobacter sp.]|nr:GrpB family protein [Rubrobacter sp.]